MQKRWFLALYFIFAEPTLGTFKRNIAIKHYGYLTVKFLIFKVVCDS